ncbi:CG10713 [Drosophila busckii]|uniref:CG10713 n=1 Tax=Drosophila busckii TaxID=30019 RepID=A0A0M4F052_DROBS|nr:CG10713 [Drosophila busckii]
MRFWTLADDAYSAYHHHQSSSNNSSCNNSRYATPRRHNSGSNIRHAAAATAAAPPTLATSASTAAVSATPIPITTSQPRRQSQQLQQYHQALLQHADSQLLPSHLKCGMCASLVLASVFVAGTKFYFDHQGTGLEVLIFCAFSATFFLAACMVSLCRIPKGLIRSRSDGRAACQSRGVSAGAGSNANGCMLELNDVRYLDERQVEISAATAAAAAAGPPPYHIAILLPEQTQTILGKQLPLDESPPPSYDKILV